MVSVAVQVKVAQTMDVIHYGIAVNSSQTLSLRPSGGFFLLKNSPADKPREPVTNMPIISLISIFPFSNETYQENTDIHDIFEPYANDTSYKKPDKGEIEFRVVL